MKDGHHVPLRTCLGCGTVDEQRALIRLVRRGDGALGLDIGRRAGGRGGYLHRRPECWEQFAQRKGQLRSFRAGVDRPARAVLVAQLRSGVDE